MDEQTARILIPKLNALRTFLKNVANGGQYLPDNETRRNYRAIYSDIKATLNDPNLEIYAPSLPHLGTFMGDVSLQGDHQMRILDSGTRLIAYLDSQLLQVFPTTYKPVSDRLPKKPKDALTNISIENFQGVLGNIEHSNVSQNLELSIVKGDFESLSKKLSDLRVEQKDVEELQTALESEPILSMQQKFGPKVGTWIGNMVQKAATGAWEIGINSAGNILAVLITKYYGFWWSRQPQSLQWPTRLSDPCHSLHFGYDVSKYDI